MLRLQYIEVRVVEESTKGTFRVPSTLSPDREWWEMAYTFLAAQVLIALKG